MRMIDVLGDGVFSVVLDSYDYANALERVIPSVAKAKTDRGGVLIMRPDSGDPLLTVLQALRAGEATFGCVRNSKGFKAPKNGAYNLHSAWRLRRPEEPAAPCHHHTPRA